MSHEVWTPRRHNTRGKKYPEQRQQQSSQQRVGFPTPDAVRRTDNLKRYMQKTHLTVDSLAEKIQIPINRLEGYLDGRNFFGNELAMHIEEMLELPPSWLDLPEAVVPEVDSINENPLLSDSKIIEPDDHFSTAVVDIHQIKPETDSFEEIKPMILPMQKANLDRQAKLDARRSNLVMLTLQRGSKNQLAILAGTNPSRISLMSSGRKPVSDPFAQAIEEGLALGIGWLDTRRNTDEVPPNVWQLLHSNESANTNLIDSPNSVFQHSRKAHSEAVVQFEKAAEVAVVSVANVTKATDQIQTNSAARNALFVKQVGTTGPIAEALAKTVLRLSESDQLSEEKAFQVLGMLLSAERHS